MADDGLDRTIPSMKLPRAHGARNLTAYANGKTVTVRGGIILGPLDRSAWRNRVDHFRWALARGPANLYFETDRYYRCMQAKLFDHPLPPTGYGRLALDISVTFEGPDPRAFDTTVHTDTWNSPADGGTRNITVAGGNAFVDPTFAIMVGGAGAQAINLAITNNTTAKYFTIVGSITGGSIVVVDCLEKTVEIGGVDMMSLFDGEFFGLELGINNIQHDTNSGSTSQIVTTWQERYW